MISDRTQAQLRRQPAAAGFAGFRTPAEKSNIPNKKFFADSVHPNEQEHIILMEFLLDSLIEHTNLDMSN